MGKWEVRLGQANRQAFPPMEEGKTQSFLAGALRPLDPPLGRTGGRTSKNPVLYLNVNIF